MSNRTWLIGAVGLFVAMGARPLLRSADGDEKTHGQNAPADAPHDVATGDVKALTDGNNRFAFDLYQRVREKDGNLLFSPVSISAALAMTAAGADGKTERQMAAALHFGLPREQLHPAFAALAAALRETGKPDPTDASGQPPKLKIANRLWPGLGEALLEGYVGLVRRDYGAELERLNFGDASAAAARINAWIAEQTEQRIPELLQPEAVRNASLVLTNAVYFKASWLLDFEPSATQPGDFTRGDGTVAQAAMMHRQGRFGYFDGDGFQALELPYVGRAWSMIVVLPDSGQFGKVEQQLTAEQFSRIVAELGGREVRVALPKWTFRSRFSLPEALQALGMKDAFRAGAADFSRMDGTRELFISDVLHEAFVAVDEAGTEAAAATAVVMVRGAAPAQPLEVRVDRPFVFAIYDRTSGTILFLGRVVDPAAQ